MRTKGSRGREQELESAYVVDLAWLRTTPWRERLAASFDPPARRASLATIEGFTIRHQSSSTASALLLVGWLASRLDWDTRPLVSRERHRNARTCLYRTLALDRHQARDRGAGRRRDSPGSR